MQIDSETPPAAATDEPAVSTTHDCRDPDARVSDQLTESLIAAALETGQDSRPGRLQREDGWTPERIAIFLHTLAEGGVVKDACLAAGMSKQSAFALRNSAKGRAFLLAWRAALVLARRRLADDVMNRAINGVVDVVYRDGKVWGERHRYDNRLTMAVLNRLDRLAAAADELEGPVRVVAEEFDQFVEIASKGGDRAADFVRDRMKGSELYQDEAELLVRSENYLRYGVGLPEEIDVSDLDKEDMANWTDEQAERARRSRILEPPKPDAVPGFRNAPGEAVWGPIEVEY